ncbi:hypothetical protein IPG41_06640 [Candidatus Peregrinibacteria bacterium]|nr:MAG: hypothetical protein IPG41_06640 [Candidatus Peregrinibacteria bacterium]
MKYRAIISEAWALTQENKKLIWMYGFVPALLGALFSVGYFSYQFAAFWTSPYVHPGIPEDKHALNFLFNVLRDGLSSHTSFTVFALVILALFALCYLMVPVFAQGALIQILAHKRAGQEVSTVQGITFGFTRFLQLFEYHLVLRTFSVVGLAGEAAFVYRNAGPGIFAFVGWFFLLAIVIGLLVTLLFTYAEYYLVIDKEGVVSSMLKSSGLVVRQWHHTLFMLLLMSIIVIRLALNVAVALLVPLLILGPFFLFTSLTTSAVLAAVGGLLALVALYFASYFLATFHVFATGVWTFTFLDLTKEDQGGIDLHEAAVHQEE